MGGWREKFGLPLRGIVNVTFFARPTPEQHHVRYVVKLNQALSLPKDASDDITVGSAEVFEMAEVFLGYEDRDVAAKAVCIFYVL